MAGPVAPLRPLPDSLMRGCFFCSSADVCFAIHQCPAPKKKKLFLFSSLNGCQRLLVCLHLPAAACVCGGGHFWMPPNKNKKTDSNSRLTASHYNKELCQNKNMASGSSSAIKSFLPEKKGRHLGQKQAPLHVSLSSCCKPLKLQTR